MTDSTADESSNTDKELKTLRSDILIVGGGMVGMSLALLLAKACSEQKIILLDAHPVQSSKSSSELYQPSFDARSTAISADSVNILSRLGIWSNIEKHSTSIDTVHVSDRGHIGSTRYTREQNNHQALGYVVDNTWLGRCLTDAVLSQQNLYVYGEVKASQPIIHADSVQIKLSHETFSEASAKLLIVADGAQSQLRDQLGIATQEHDYHQHAVIANVQSEQSHRGVAFERFTSVGPMALLPRGESAEANASALVWTTPEDDVEKVMQWSDANFLAELQNAFGYRLGKFVQVGNRQHYPLKKIFAAEQVRQRVVLMGNAAHFLHPVAGQGFNLALRDANKLAEVLSNEVIANIASDVGDLNVLQRYLDQQEKDQWLTTALSHNFNRLFSSDHRAVQGARNIGLLSLNHLLPVQQSFFQQMMGRGPQFS